MKPAVIPSMLLAGVSWFLAGQRVCWSEDMVPGQATDFSAVEYYPGSQQVHIRTSGSEATQVGDSFLVKNFKLEWFGADGRLQQVATAPECMIDQINNTANSSSHLVLQSGDGKMRVEGDGFLWRQADSWLTISNHTTTVIYHSLANDAGLAARPGPK